MVSPIYQSDEFIDEQIKRKEFYKKFLHCSILSCNCFKNAGSGRNFYTSSVTDRLLAIASNTKYVDEKGYDLKAHRPSYSVDPLNISSKCMKIAFHPRKCSTNTIILSNSIPGEKTNDNIKKTIDIPYQYILIIQTGKYLSAAITRKNDVRDFFKPRGSTVNVKIPFSHLHFIIHPDEKVTAGNTGYTTISKGQKLWYDPFNVDTRDQEHAEFFWNNTYTIAK